MLEKIVYQCKTQCPEMKKTLIKTAEEQMWIKTDIKQTGLDYKIIDDVSKDQYGGTIYSVKLIEYSSE